MKDSSCPYELKVTAALLSGTMDGKFRAHVSGCSICQDIVNVSEWMQGLATAPTPQPTLPDASTIWAEARRLQRQSAKRRVTRTLAATRMIGYLVLAFGPGGWLICHWPEMQTGIARFSSSLLIPFSEDLTSAVRPLIYVMIVLFALNTALTFWSLRVERRLKP